MIPFVVSLSNSRRAVVVRLFDKLTAQGERFFNQFIQMREKPRLFRAGMDSAAIAAFKT
jgi:hypothetical protein